jgi:DNA (cytosine-5)-methyltransferase 1
MLVLLYIFHMESIRQYLSAEELAELLHVSVQHIRGLARKGKIKAQKWGKTWMIDKCTLDDKSFLYTVLPDVPDKPCTLNVRPKVIALSFFSGAMGLDIGLERAGINVCLASEIEPNTRKTILLNKPDISLIGDINDYSAEKIREFAGLAQEDEIDLIIGGPPCQAFSTAGKREGFNDNRGNVFLTFIDRILELKPKIAVVENVRGLLSAPLAHRPHSSRGFGYPPLTTDEEKGGALGHIVSLLETGGYSVSFNLYNSANYGSPQKRERVIIFCQRNGKVAPWIPPTHAETGNYGLPKWKTFRDATADLFKIEHEGLSFPENRLKYYRMLKSGQYWKHLPLHIQKEAMGASFFAGGGKTGFYRRLDWDKPCPTLVTDPTMPATDLAHPELDRPLSIQEYMRIQEFPDDWKVWGAIKDKYRQIGNAVPCSLGTAIGKHVLALLEGKDIQVLSDFQYSRYKDTDHISFKKLLKKRTGGQLSLWNHPFPKTAYDRK